MKPYSIPYLPTRAAKATHVATLVIILPGIVLRVLQRQLHLSQHEVVRLVLAGMRADDEPLRGVVFPSGLVAAQWQPLDCEAGPLERMRNDQIVEKRRVFLPYLVFLVHQPLLHFVSQFLVLVLGHGSGAPRLQQPCIRRSRAI